MFRKTTMLIAAAAIAASTPTIAADKVLKSTAIGAGAGALVGAIVPGVSVGTGALVGGAGGAIVGLSKKKHRYHYSNGRRYWVDSQGRRHY